MGLTYEECLAVPSHQCQHPFVLDETIDELNVLLRAQRTSPWMSSI